MLSLRILAIAALCLSADAHAHGGFGNASPFWSGALHLLVSPIALAGLLGYAALIVASEKILDFKSIATCAITAGFFSFHPGLLPQHFLAAGLFIVGVAAMLRLKTPLVATQIAGLFVGAIVGIGSDLDAPSVLSGLGICALSLYLGIVFIGLWDKGTEIDWLNPILLIASRVLGSWVAALGLLLAALGFRLHS